MPRSSSSATSRRLRTTFPRSCRRSTRSGRATSALRVVGLGPSSDARTIFEGLLQRGEFEVPADRGLRRASERSSDAVAATCRLRFSFSAGSSSSRSRPTSGSPGRLALPRCGARAEVGVTRARLKVPALIAGALACLALAVGLAVVAADVARWRDALPAGDVRYRVAPEDADPWTPSTIAPAGMSRALLGVEDDMELRQALRASASRGSTRRRSRSPSVALLRNEASGATRGGRVGRRRSRPGARAPRVSSASSGWRGWRRRRRIRRLPWRRRC